MKERNTKSFLRTTVSILALSLIMMTKPVLAVDVFSMEDADGPDGFVSNELLVLAEEGTKNSELRDIAYDAGGSVEAISTLEDGTRFVSIETEDSEIIDAAESIEEDDRILMVQPNYIYRLADAETAAADPRLSAQWHLLSPAAAEAETGEAYAGSADATDAWKLLEESVRESTMPVVAVIDTGVDLDHPDLQDNIIRDKCVTINNGEISNNFKKGDRQNDDDGHGTHVCGIIAADTGDSTGTAGAANNRVKLFCIDAAMPRNISFTTMDLCISVDYAVKNGARVINMSVGDLQRDPMMEVFMKNAWESGVLCVCAGGNEASRGWITPGDVAYAVSVMSHGQTGEFADYTNYGIEKDVSAPGEDILSTYAGKGYKVMSGTSMASPLVTGLAGLLLSCDDSLSPRELKNYIYTSSHKDSYDGGTDTEAGGGFGRIDYRNAAEALLSADADPQKIVMNKSRIDMYTGMWTSSLEYEVLPAASGRHADEIIFESSDERIVKVDDQGIIEACGQGTAEIRAIWTGNRNVRSNCVVTVRKPENIKIERTPFSHNGLLDDTDPMAYVDSGTYDSWGSYCDGFDIDLNAGDTIDVLMGGICMLPQIQIFDSRGTLAAYRSCNDPRYDDGRVHYTEALYKAPADGTYSIYVFNADADYDTVGKQYTLSVRREEGEKKDDSGQVPPGGTNPPGGQTGGENGGNVQEIPDRTEYTINGNSYVITGFGTASFVRAKNVKTVKMPASVKIEGRKYKVIGIEAGSFTGKKIKSVYIGSNVKEIRAYAFRRSEAGKLIVRSGKLYKRSVKGSLKGSKIRTVRVKTGSRKKDRKLVRRYKKIFTKANAGKAVKVS